VSSSVVNYFWKCCWISQPALVSGLAGKLFLTVMQCILCLKKGSPTFLSSNRHHKNGIFQVLYPTSQDFNQSLLNFSNLVDTWLILMLTCDSKNYSKWVHWCAVKGRVIIKRSEVWECVLQEFDCCMHDVPVHCPAERHSCLQQRVRQLLTYVDITYWNISLVFTDFSF